MNRRELDRIAKLEDKIQDMAINKMILIKENSKLLATIAEKDKQIEMLSNKLKEYNKNET